MFISSSQLVTTALGAARLCQRVTNVVLVSGARVGARVAAVCDDDWYIYMYAAQEAIALLCSVFQSFFQRNVGEKHVESRWNLAACIHGAAARM